MKKLLITTAMLTAFTLPAAALTFDFQDHLGNRGNTQVFGSGLDTITAKGFTAGDVGTALFGKNGGTDENGLGLANDASGDNEIQLGKGFVQINVDSLLLQNFANFQFQMASTTQGEGWTVWGSDDLHPFAMTLLATSGVDDEGLHSLPGGYDNYNFFYNGLGVGLCGSGCNANVLLSNFDATLAVPGPIVGAGLPGLVAACLGLIGLGRRRRNQVA